VGTRETGRLSRVTDKLEFLQADNAAEALLDYFSGLGIQPKTASERYPSRSIPLILISQLPRSGGSLLSQLFDGHPRLLVYPWEMKIGFPSKSRWPDLKLSDTADRLFATLFHAELALFARKGYQKSGKGRRTKERLRFNYSPIEHYQSFVSLLPSDPNRRSILDTYFCTLFEAWQPYKSNANAVVGFVPKMASFPDSIASFFQDYPDGRLISILRDPADWFASRRAHTKSGQVRYGHVDEEMRIWNRMARNALRYQKDYGEQFFMLSFRDLVTNREGTLRRLVQWCGVDFNPCLLEQTFDGNPIESNTNFDDPEDRLSEAVLERKRGLAKCECQNAYELTQQMRAELERAGLHL
jgi:hypothetical protein